MAYNECPQCCCECLPTLWMPQPGYDHNLREFRCPRCNEDFYNRVTNPLSLSQITTLQERMTVELETQKQAAKTAPRASPDTAASLPRARTRRARRGSGR